MTVRAAAGIMATMSALLVLACTSSPKSTPDAAGSDADTVSATCAVQADNALRVDCDVKVGPPQRCQELKRIVSMLTRLIRAPHCLRREASRRGEYALTPFGRRFIGVIEEVRRLQDAFDRGAIKADDSREDAAARSGRLTRRCT